MLVGNELLVRVVQAPGESLDGVAVYGKFDIWVFLDQYLELDFGDDEPAGLHVGNHRGIARLPGHDAHLADRGYWREMRERGAVGRIDNEFARQEDVHLRALAPELAHHLPVAERCGPTDLENLQGLCW